MAMTIVARIMMAIISAPFMATFLHPKPNSARMRGIVDRGGEHRQHEGDLVDQIGQIVDDRHFRHVRAIAETDDEKAERVERPAYRHDKAQPEEADPHRIACALRGNFGHAAEIKLAQEIEPEKEPDQEAQSRVE